MGKKFWLGGFGEDLHVGNSMINLYINMGFWSVGEKCLMKCPIRVGTWRMQESYLMGYLIFKIFFG